MSVNHRYVRASFHTGVQGKPSALALKTCLFYLAFWIEKVVDRHLEFIFHSRFTHLLSCDIKAKISVPTALHSTEKQ